MLYVLALSAVAVLSVIAQVLIQTVLLQQSADSRVVNIAGQQRMVSQRLSKAALAIQATTDPQVCQSRVTELRTAVTMLEHLHRGLQHGDPALGLPGRNSPTVRMMFQKLEPSYQAIREAARQMLDRADEVGEGDVCSAPVDLSPFIREILKHEPTFQQHMNSMAFQYDLEARERVDLARRLELTVLGVTLGVLFFEAVFVFRPSVGEIRQTLAEVKQAERQLARANADLTVALQKTQDATRAKSDFLAVMSHEIRTPLSAVIGMTDMLLETPLTPEQREYADTVQTSSRSLLGIINGILDLSKIEAGQLEMEHQPLDIRQCVQEALDIVVPRAADRELELLSFVDPDVPYLVVGDVTRLRQIMVNLLGNAVKFTERGEVVMFVRDQGTGIGGREPGETPDPSPSPRHNVHVAVRDTGIGIPPDRLERIFQSFSQVDVSTARKYGGTGLGLTISKHLVEQMGGTIGVESEVGRGSTFHVTIPIDTVAEPLPDYLQPAQPHLAGRQVLVVDDNDTSRLLLSRHLAAWHMRPWSVGSAGRALELLCQGERFDMAILDMDMPDLDGITLAAAIREYGHARALPLVILTSPGVRVEGMYETDVAAFLSKPVKWLRLYHVLVGICTGRSLRRHDSPLRECVNPQMATLHPLRILLAEDNPVNQKVALHVLSKSGYRADVAVNGWEVLEALKRQPYDMILMDIQMPGLDGIETTRYIRQHWSTEQAPPPRIVALTASALRDDCERFLEAGMDDYLSKPIRLKELVAVLERCQSRHTLPDGGEEPKLPCKERSENGPVVDPEALEQLGAMMGERADEQVQELKDLFLKNTGRLLDAMDEALGQGDAQQLRYAAHTLKSTSATVGAVRLSARCAELERRARQGYFEGAEERVEQIKREFERVFQVFAV
jgi:signal transduction histidine kinase/DNA-binding response OmpR family regulator